ncbi:MAG: response regulator [Alphaproteobacteria bacterium]|nr:response regulator [Alphaproteobacteria bacterium]
MACCFILQRHPFPFVPWRGAFSLNFLKRFHKKSVGRGSFENDRASIVLKFIKKPWKIRRGNKKPRSGTHFSLPEAAGMGETAPTADQTENGTVPASFAEESVVMKLPAVIRRYRPYMLQLLALVICAGIVGGTIYRGSRAVDEALLWVDHSNLVISKNQEFSIQTQRMLASRRGYALSGDKDALNEYGASKAAASDLIAELNTLMKDDVSQVSRLNELQHYFLDFSGRLDALQPLAAQPGQTSAKAAEKAEGATTETIQTVSDNLARVGQDMLLKEQDLLNARMKAVDAQRRASRMALIIACVLSVMTFLSFGGYIFYTRLRKEAAEKYLGETDEIFRVAVEGVSDGIFEWNLARDTAFYSRQFWAMLGYGDDKQADTMEAYRELLHPDDRARVLSHLEKYLSGEISEYLIVFRMKHKSGRWAWINARAQALYDEAGKPTRLVGAHTDISHIKAYEEKLQKAKEQAESANRAKTDFLAHMSHEIRTPLTAISGIAEIFEAEEGGFGERQRHLVQTLVSSTSSLKDLVNDILDFSKIESGELALEDKLFGLRDLFDQVISIFSQRAAEKGLDFRFDYETVRLHKFYGDRARLRQILINLIGNALKFTSEGSVDVEVRQEQKESGPFLRIKVRDTGIGVEPQNFSLIFERFKQADSSVSRKYGGTGLGLPISKRLAGLMGGDISVESAPGEGSTFTLLVPMKTQETQKDDESDEKVSKTLTDSIRGHALENKNILLVEDYEGNVVMLSYLLDSLECNYDIARTGLEALNMWREKDYDLVLMDIQMPEMDGFTATEQIRRMEQEKSLPRTPIIGMTAHALVGDREKCIEAGMDTYLAKPIVELDLKAKIIEYLSRRQKVA